MYDNIIVVGNGKTSRANVEALIDDYIYAAPKVKVTFYSTLGVLSEGQVWLKQYLADKEIAHESVRAFPDKATEKDLMFILWSDEDQESLLGLSKAQELGIKAYDLTNGLVALTPSADIRPMVAPEIPEQEQVSEEEAESIQRGLEDVAEGKTSPADYFLVEDDEDDDEDLFESDDVDGILLKAAVNVIAKAIAVAVAEEFKKLMDK